MRRLTLGLIVWLNLLSALGSLAWARTWTDTTGRFKVEAELVEVKDGKAVLKKADGPVVAVALEKLSPADREYVNQWAALKREHPWLDTDAPFDVVTFLAPVPEGENAARLYLDALFEFGSDVAYLFSPEEQQRRSPIARKRDAELTRHLLADEAGAKDPKPVNPAELAAWLAEYESGFQKLALAQQRPRCAFPCALSVTSLLGHPQCSRSVARVLSYRTRQDLQHGDFERPLQGVEMVLRLSRDLRPRGCGVSQLVSIALDTQCCDTLVREILLAPGLRREHCDRLLAALARHEAETLDPFQESQRVAYLQTRKLLYDYLHRSDLFDGQKVQKEYGMRDAVVFPLGNLALYASLTDAKWRLAREKYGNGLPGGTSAAKVSPDQAEKSVELMRRALSGTMTSEECAREAAAVNRVFTTILGTASKTALQHQRACADPRVVEPLRSTTVAIFFEPEDFVPIGNACLRHEATQRGTQCLVALRRWQLDHREPPPDLESLVKAAGMKSVPIDPYCDQPLRLAASPAAPVIYSVGPDGVDDGARTVWDGAPTHAGDFVFRLDPPRR